MPTCARRSTLLGLLLSFSTLLAACGGGSPSPAPVSATLKPSDGLLFNVDTAGSVAGEPLVITFGASMAPDTVVLGGSVGAEPHTSTWSTGAVASDTLTLRPSPQATWTEGTGRSLQVRGTTTGGAAVTQSFPLDVYRTIQGYVAVSPAGGSITTNQSLMVTFLFPADPNTLVLGGSLLSGVSYQRTWAPDHGHVTLAPSGGWFTGASQELTVQVVSSHSAALTAQGSFNFTVAGTSPTGVLSPAGGAIGSATPITVNFSTTMDQASLTLGGALATAGVLRSWSTARVADDTVTLTPLDFWPPGTVDLVVSAADLDGFPLLASAVGTYQVPVNATCGAVGACVNATDCAYGVATLAGWTQACFVAHVNDQAATATCIQASPTAPATPVTAGCADCAAAYAFCAKASCLSQCAPPGGLTSAGCVACLAPSCTPTFTACSGRSL